MNHHIIRCGLFVPVNLGAVLSDSIAPGPPRQIGELLCQEMEFEYLGVFFTSECEMERWKAKLLI